MQWRGEIRAFVFVFSLNLHCQKLSDVVPSISCRVLTELVSKMKDMQMDKTELGCLRAIVLFNPGQLRLHSLLYSMPESQTTLKWICFLIGPRCLLNEVDYDAKHLCVCIWHTVSSSWQVGGTIWLYEPVLPVYLYGYLYMWLWDIAGVMFSSRSVWLYCECVVVFPDAKGLSNPVEVEGLREKVYASLESYTKQKYPDQPGR